MLTIEPVYLAVGGALIGVVITLSVQSVLARINRLHDKMIKTYEIRLNQVGDKGVDGVARFPVDAKGRLGKVLVSVKGGKTVTPAFVRDLDGTINAQRAAMGVLISQVPASRGVLDAINHGGTYKHPANGQIFPRLQHVTIADLLAGRRPQMPSTVLPYIPASQLVVPTESTPMFDL